jgi:hypothetical protein
MREFSKFQYLPTTKSFWIAQSVANCDNLNEMLDAAKHSAVTVPIYVNGVISQAFKPVAGIVQAPAATP